MTKDKNSIASEIRSELTSKGISVSGEDFERPWGGFFKIGNESLPLFLNNYFNGIELPFDISRLNVSPKILVVEPGKKLS